MKVVASSEIEKFTIKGVKGEAVAQNLISVEDGFEVGLRTLNPHSDIPKPPHFHKNKQINYIISGEVEFTSGDTTVAVKEGDFIIFDSNEPHTVKTRESPALVFEVKYLDLNQGKD